MTMPGPLNTAWVNTQIVNASDMNSVAATVNALETLCVPLTSIGSTPVAGAVVEWDTNKNLNANNMEVGLTSIPTAGGTTTLTISSAGIIVFTGTQNQTCVLASGSVPAGLDTLIINQSTGTITVNASAGGQIITLGPLTTGQAASALFTAIVSAPTTAAGWNYQHLGIDIAAGKIMHVSNTLTFQGTDGTTFTFPTANDTIVGLAAAQTLTNKTLLNTGAGNVVAGGQLALTTAFSLTNSTVLTNILTTTIPTGSLQVGSTFKIKIFGTLAWGASAGTLTLLPQLGATVSTMQPQMAAQGSSAAAQLFSCEILMTVRSTGAGGTYMAYGYGEALNGTAVVPIVPTTATATAAINTTSATPTLQIAAQWSSAAAGNVLNVVEATLERVA